MALRGSSAGLLARGTRTDAAQRVWRVLRGDTVQITGGRDKGQTGTVLKVLRAKDRVLVQGRNLVKKHVKRQGDDDAGGIVTMEAPLHVSNVAVLDPQTRRPVRVGFRFDEEGNRVRVSRGSFASGEVIPRPEVLKERSKPRLAGAGPKDTPHQAVGRVTYVPPAMPPSE